MSSITPPESSPETAHVSMPPLPVADTTPLRKHCLLHSLVCSFEGDIEKLKEFVEEEAAKIKSSL